MFADTFTVITCAKDFEIVVKRDCENNSYTSFSLKFNITGTLALVIK